MKESDAQGGEAITTLLVRVKGFGHLAPPPESNARRRCFIRGDLGSPRPFDGCRRITSARVALSPPAPSRSVYWLARLPGVEEIGLSFCPSGLQRITRRLGSGRTKRGLGDEKVGTNAKSFQLYLAPLSSN